MDQPLGYVVSGSEHLVCRLSKGRKALYGLKQSPRARFYRFSVVVLGYGFQHSHSAFVRHSSTSTIVLIVYVDDIIISRSNSAGITNLKRYLGLQFHTKNLGTLRYYLEIEVACSSQSLFLFQQKYVLDLLTKTGFLCARPTDTPMDSTFKPFFLVIESTVKLDKEQGELFSDFGRYRHLVRKLIYLRVTRPDITYVVGVVNQFMKAPR